MAELRFPTPPLVDEVVRLRRWREKDVPVNLMMGIPTVSRTGIVAQLMMGAAAACGTS